MDTPLGLTLWKQRKNNEHRVVFQAKKEQLYLDKWDKNPNNLNVEAIVRVNFPVLNHISTKCRLYIYNIYIYTWNGRQNDSSIFFQYD